MNILTLVFTVIELVVAGGFQHDLFDVLDALQLAGLDLPGTVELTVWWLRAKWYLMRRRK